MVGCWAQAVQSHEPPLICRQGFAEFGQGFPIPVVFTLSRLCFLHVRGVKSGAVAHYYVNDGLPPHCVVIVGWLDDGRIRLNGAAGSPDLARTTLLIRPGTGSAAAASAVTI